MNNFLTADNVVIFVTVVCTLWGVDCANRAFRHRRDIRREFLAMEQRWRIGDLSAEMKRVTYWRHFTDLLILADWRKAYGRELWNAAPRAFGRRSVDASTPPRGAD